VLFALDFTQTRSRRIAISIAKRFVADCQFLASDDNQPQVNPPDDGAPINSGVQIDCRSRCPDFQQGFFGNGTAVSTAVVLVGKVDDA
jgi:hypothetical protein